MVQVVSEAAVVAEAAVEAVVEAEAVAVVVEPTSDSGNPALSPLS